MKNWDVCVVDNLSSGYQENVPEKAKFVLADLSVENQLEILADEKFEVIFHLASHVGQESSFADPYKDLSSNTLPTIELLKWAPRFQTKHLIFASSVNVYGNPSIMPITEQ